MGTWILAAIKKATIMKLDTWPTPLPTSTMKIVVSSMRWHPGWNFTVFEDPHEGPVLRIVTSAYNHYEPTRSIDLGINSRIPTCLIHTIDDFQRWLLWRLEEIDSHECREALWFAGKIYRDPHDPFVP